MLYVSLRSTYRVIDICREDCRGNGERPDTPCQVNTSATSPLCDEWFWHSKSGQAGRFGLFGKGRGCEEPFSNGPSACPAAVPDECRDSGAEERSVLIVKIRTGARRYAQPRLDGQVILDKDPRHDIGVCELGHVVRPVCVPLCRNSSNPSVASRASRMASSPNDSSWRSCSMISPKVC